MILKENSQLNRYEWAAKKVTDLMTELNKKDIVLYDIGARDNILKQYIPATGIDYKAFDLYPLNESAQQWDIENPFPYQYPVAQIVTMLEVVEHLKNPWLCMQNVANIIAPGGYLILTTPNPAWSSSRINLLNKGFLSCFTQSDLDLNHHVFTAWPHIVQRLLTDTSFEVTMYSTLDGHTRIFDKNLKGISAPVKLISRLIKKGIEAKDPSSMGMSYGLIARKSA